MISRRLLRIKAMHVLFAYFNSNNNDIMFFEKELEKSINKFYDLYLAVFELLRELRYFAENKIEQRRHKHIPTFEDLNPNEKFIKNQILYDVELMLSTAKLDNRTRFQWNQYPEVIKHLYSSLETSEAYMAYMQEATSYSGDKQIIYYTIEQLLADNDEFYDLLEDLSIYWNDDIEMALSMNIRTIQRMRFSKGSSNKLMPLFKNKDDHEFVKKLFRKTIANHERNNKIIDNISANWEPDRIAKVDKVILELAMVEFTEFPLIPIPVTLNEYIDMAKYYSTERSYTFINGILDNTVSILRDEGLINKTGVGLLEELKEEKDDDEK